MTTASAADRLIEQLTSALPGPDREAVAIALGLVRGELNARSLARRAAAVAICEAVAPVLIRAGHPVAQAIGLGTAALCALRRGRR